MVTLAYIVENAASNIVETWSGTITKSTKTYSEHTFTHVLMSTYFIYSVSTVLIDVTHIIFSITCIFGFKCHGTYIFCSYTFVATFLVEVIYCTILTNNFIFLIFTRPVMVTTIRFVFIQIKARLCKDLYMGRLFK